MIPQTTWRKKDELVIAAALIGHAITIQQNLSYTFPDRHLNAVIAACPIITATKRCIAISVKLVSQQKI